MKHKYKPADKFIVFHDHDDPDLRPIKYALPEPPPLEDIDGYGLPPEDQFWSPKLMPTKLAELNADTKRLPSEKIEVLENNQVYFTNEIEYIKTEWERRTNGYWFFNNGKPTFITGDNYYYLQWWPIEGKKVAFRMRDREFWLFTKMCDDDPLTFGFNFPKHRREGATTKATCKRFLVASSVPYSRVSLQSKDYNHAQEVHQVYMGDQFRYETPFWFMPIWDQNNMAQNQISFYAPNAKTQVDTGKTALKSIIDFRDSGEKAYDGLKIRFLHVDESGKTEEADVKRRWEIQRQCLAQGASVYGKSIHTSTVDEMTKGGGRNFKNVADQSHYHERDETGMTTSGLYNFFMPASEGFGDDMPIDWQKKFKAKSWVDKYGFDVLHPQTKRPLAELYHLAKVKSYRDRGDYEGVIEYTRQFPLWWKDCWKESAKECNFDLSIIEERLDHYRNGNNDKQRGNFAWKDGRRDTEVIWEASPEGKFYLSYQFPDPRNANKHFLEDGIRIPGNTTKFVAGGDPYKFKTTKGKKKSKGAGAVFQMFDAAIDGNNDVNLWKTNRFVCSYSYRPADKKIYGEDMLMMCVYFGCKMYPEINVESLWEYFIERGYASYLFFQVDKKTGKLAVNPGEQTGEKTRESIFRETQYHIKHHGHREVHDEWLEECKAIEDDMGDFDRFTAHGLALVAARRDSFIVREVEKRDIANIIPMYTYSPTGT